jgi:molecular chaperone Hsp33
MTDHLARTVTTDGAVRGLAAVTTDLVEEARTRHGTLPTATAALGRALTAALLLAGTLKHDERLALEFRGDGPLHGILADATPDGDVRGFALRPRTHLPARGGKLDVGGALGHGILCVMRVPLAGGSLYRSVVPLVSGEIGGDVASYLLTSEQSPAAVGVGVFVEADGRVGAAGGYLLQAMPGAAPATIDRLAARVEAGAAPSDLVRQGLGAHGILGHLLDGIPLRPLDERPVRFHCRCTRDRVFTAILALGRAELGDILAGERRAEVVCEFCATRYLVEEDELRALLAEMEGAGASPRPGRRPQARSTTVTPGPPAPGPASWCAAQYGDVPRNSCTAPRSAPLPIPWMTRTCVAPARTARSRNVSSAARASRTRRPTRLISSTGSVAGRSTSTATRSRVAVTPISRS